MNSGSYDFPVAISRFSASEPSREPQNLRAIRWLLDQPGGPLAVVTPQKRLHVASLQHLVSRPGVLHQSWRGLSVGVLHRRRALVAWPDRRHLNDLWGADADALVVIEWNEEDTREWIEDARPVQLLADRVIQPSPVERSSVLGPALPTRVAEILEYVADMAAGYSTGLKWNEEDMLKADMMNRPERWAQVTVEQVREKCRALGMRPNDVDTVAGILQRRKEGRRFNVRGSYRTFHFE